MITNKLNDFVWKGTITNQVSQAVDLIRLLSFDVRPDCLQRVQVGVNIRQDGNLHSTHSR